VLFIKYSIILNNKAVNSQFTPPDTTHRIGSDRVNRTIISNVFRLSQTDADLTHIAKRDSTCSSSRLLGTALIFTLTIGLYSAREGEAVVRSPTNMAATKIAAVDYSKMTSLDRPACLRPGHGFKRFYCYDST